MIIPAVPTDFVVATEWLDSLEHHPIFTDPISNEDVNNIDSQRGDAKGNGRAATLQSANVPPKCKQTRLACTDRELFVAVGHQIRYVELVNLKYSWVVKNPLTYDRGGRDSQDGVYASQKEPYDTLDSSSWSDLTYLELDTPEINFDIRALVLNTSKKYRYIAVVGDSEIAVVEVSPDDLAGATNTTRRCRTRLVNPTTYASKGIPVAKVAWHPLGRDGSYLAVLTQNAVLCLYDIDKNVDAPEQTYQFSNLGSLRSPSRFNIAQWEEAVSFCFGTTQNIWGPFTVYVLMREGDVRALSPFVPKNWSADRKYIQELACVVRYKYNKMQKQSEYTDEHQAYMEQYRCQLKWVQDCLRQLEGQPQARSPVFQAPSCITRQPVVQGPFVYRPRPPEPLHAYDASDIMCLDTDPACVVVIAFDNGQLYLCLELEKIEASWKKGWQQPVLSMVEYVNLDFESVKRLDGTEDDLVVHYPCLMADPGSKYRFYVYHTEGVHCVSVRPWMHELRRMFEQQKNISMEDLMENYQSEIHWMAVVDDGPDPIVGACVVKEDTKLGYAILMMTASRSTSSRELYEDPYERMKRCSVRGVAPNGTVANYTSLTDLLRGKSRILPLHMSRRSSNEDFTVYREGIKNITERITFLQQCATDMLRGVADLNQVVQNDVTRVSDAFLRCKDANEIGDQVARMRDRQVTLDERLHALIRKMAYWHSPTTEEEQEQYLAVLDRINNEVERFKPLMHKYNTQRKAVRVESSADGEDATQRSETERSVSLIKNALQRETEMLEETRQRIEEMQERMAQLNIDK